MTQVYDDPGGGTNSNILVKSRTLTDAVLYIVLDKAFTLLMNHFTYGYNRSLTDLKYLITTATVRTVKQTHFSPGLQASVLRDTWTLSKLGVKNTEIEVTLHASRIKTYF